MQVPSCGQSLVPPSYAPRSEAGSRITQVRRLEEPTSTRRSGTEDNIKTTNLSSYVRIDPGKIPRVNDRGELIVPGISLQVPDFEKKYEEKFSKLVEDIEKINNHKDIKIEKRLKYYFNVAFVLSLVLIAIAVIILIIWGVSRIFGE